MTDPIRPVSDRPGPHVDESLVTYTHVIYALHALAVLIGVCDLPHDRLQLRRRPALDHRRDHELRAPLGDARHLSRIAFPLADPHLLVRVAVGVRDRALSCTVVGALLGSAGSDLALGIWIAYRVIRGWLALKDRRPMYV